jgi:hypothetical protein
MAGCPSPFVAAGLSWPNQVLPSGYWYDDASRYNIALTFPEDMETTIPLDSANWRFKRNGVIVGTVTGREWETTKKLILHVYEDRLYDGTFTLDYTKNSEELVTSEFQPYQYWNNLSTPYES